MRCGSYSQSDPEDIVVTKTPFDPSSFPRGPCDGIDETGMVVVRGQVRAGMAAVYIAFEAELETRQTRGRSIPQSGNFIKNARLVQLQGNNVRNMYANTVQENTMRDIRYRRERAHQARRML